MIAFQKQNHCKPYHQSTKCNTFQFQQSWSTHYSKLQPRKILGFFYMKEKTRERGLVIIQGMLLPDVPLITSQSTTIAAVCRGQRTNIWPHIRQLLCRTVEERGGCILGNRYQIKEILAHLQIWLCHAIFNLFWCSLCILAYFRAISVVFQTKLLQNWKFFLQHSMHYWFSPFNGYILNTSTTPWLNMT